MSSEQFAIRASNLSKCYQIYDQPRDRLKQAIVPRLTRLASPLIGLRPRDYYREFWALKDVSFNVRQGEAVGIIGRNGAGKSTLLQIIAGTVTPTSGASEVNGRVAALLELGSGFNPEFTGRENVFLSAALFGLSSDDTRARMDEIEAFADIGDFIDQPIKVYSSGMVMRLAFAVQTEFEPEILIVDEALSVGDIFFQAKCMVRLRQLIARGVTLLFVSHDTGTVRQICDRAILLHRGLMVEEGNAAKVADRYMQMEIEDRNKATVTITSPPPNETSKAEGIAAAAAAVNPAASFFRQETPTAPVARSIWAPDLQLGQESFLKRAAFNRSGNRDAEFVNVQMIKDGRLCDIFDYGDPVTLRQVVRFNKKLRNVNVAYKIRTLQGVDAVFGDTRLQNEMGREYLAEQTYVFEWRFRLQMMHGKYCILSGLARPPDIPGEDWRFIDVIPLCYDFQVSPRREGMTNGLVSLDNILTIRMVNDRAAR